MGFPYFVVDAFAERPFGGNPAGVCPLERWPSDALLQSIAFENNLSETAFFVPDRDRFHLRWFTPAAEVDLCGHATLAAAHVLFEHRGHARPSVAFDSRSGPLTVTRERGGLLGLDFPALASSPADAPPALLRGLGLAPSSVLAGLDYVAVYRDPGELLRLAPDREALRALDRRGVIATAPGRDADYVLRYFAPKVGIDEDPVTGSAQCLLAPYWAARLGKREMAVRQLSFRGGALRVELKGDRVKILGTAKTYLAGEIHAGGSETEHPTFGQGNVHH